MAFSVQYWAAYTDTKPKLRRRSEEAVESNTHVLKFLYDPETKVASSVVQASQRDRSYRVEVVLGDGHDVLMSTCGCPLGQYECHHVAAVLLYGYKCVSKTDVPQQWLKQPKTKLREWKSIADMYPPKKPEYKALNRPVTDADRDGIYEELSKLGHYIAAQWHLAPEPMKDTALPVPAVEDLLSSQEYVTSKNPNSWLRRALLVPEPAIHEIAELTSGQRNNTLWGVLRKLRFTASNFGDLISAAKRRRMSDSLRRKLLQPYNLESVRSCAWGIVHEERALAAYTARGAIIKPTCLWLHESGVLGASPDSFVVCPPTGDVHFDSEQAKHVLPGVVEVKCPYSARDMTITEAATSLKAFFLEINDGHLRLKRSSSYYDQVQGQMYLTSKMGCDLLVWTPKDMEIIRIARDPLWITNISLLIDFYFNTFLSSLN